MLNYEYPPLGGGAANATKYILKEFTSFEKLEIHLVTSSIKKYKIEKLSSNISIHYLDIGKKGNIHCQSNKDLLSYSYKAYKYSKKLHRKGNFDLCHAFFGIPCGYIAMKLGIPYIVSLRGSDVPFYNKRFEKLDKLIFKDLSIKIWKKSKATIANSGGLKTLANKSFPDFNIDIIFNGIDINRFTPMEKKKENKKLVIISTGRLIERKGYHFLLEAIKPIREKVEVRLIGDGNQKEELLETVRKNELNVYFLGIYKQEDLPAELNKADVFILPSMNEGMSNSVLEAMACGLPVIATNVGGSDELIKNNGYIIKKTNIHSITDAIKKYLLNKSLLSEHGKNSRKIAKKLSWKSVAENYFDVYKSCVE
ncbi:MAG: glycosyltransferase family 4 protein [Ignavibacteriae bacterium]|nr:glycosyltransferase family 4 protein [Ignavibacteriota bacterium]